MKKYFIRFFLMVGGLLILSRPAISASPPAMAVPPLLALSEIKITGDEFIVLKNNTGKDIADLSSYWLDGYNSNQPLSAGVTNTAQQLPAVKLAGGQTVLLSSNGMVTCGAAVTAKLSVSLTDSSGFLQLIQTTQTSLGITKFPIDYASWSSAADNAIPNVPSSTKDPKAAYYRYAVANGYSWQLADIDSSNACQLDVANTTSSVSSGLTAPATAVPSVAGISTQDETITLPAADIGLAAPQISEVLPNPAPPQTDADDEFIELYNSNNKDFDLSGFVLQVGTTTLHKYTFPAGTMIGPKKFEAFYSADTGLSLSNSSGQVSLLDPSGNMLNQTDVYGTAKDGYSWVSADGLWQWTTVPTPNTVNKIAAPLAKSSSKSSTDSSKKSASTKAPAAVGSNSSGPSSGTPVSSLHPAVLAGIGSLAVVYAMYEYRNDLANQLHRLRRYRTARRVAG
jgi:hypothetical protein